MMNKGLLKYLCRASLLLAVVLSTCQTAPTSPAVEQDVDTLSSGFTKTLEAEHAQVKATFVKKGDTGSSAGGYLTQPTGVKNSRNPGEEATLSFKVPRDGSYTMWTRLYGPSRSTDAVYLGFDGKLHRKFPRTHGKYQWVKVTSQQLKAGSHRVSFGHGEAKARVDMVVVTSERLDYKTLNSFIKSAPTPEKANYLDILGEREGFGKKTTGGKGGKVVVVTNLNDRGAGSLREAVSLPGPRWIVFRKGLRGTINLRSNLKVTGDKTVDGRGADITLAKGTVVIRTDNVILTHLKFSGADDDAIRIMDGASNIWIHRNTLSNAGDGLIDVIFASKNITVSWNEFSNHVKAMLFGLEGRSGDTAITATVHHNFFDGTGERMPRLRWGKIHSYNNYIADWNWAPAYAEAGGEIYSEANVYEAGQRKRASNYKKGDPGYLHSVNDRMLNGAYHNATKPEKVFKPSSFYSYKVDRADAKLKSTVLSQAGWRSVSSPIN